MSNPNANPPRSPQLHAEVTRRLSWPLFLLGGLSLALGALQAGFVPSMIGTLALLAARVLRMAPIPTDARVQDLNAARAC